MKTQLFRATNRTNDSVCALGWTKRGAAALRVVGVALALLSLIVGCELEPAEPSYDAAVEADCERLADLIDDLACGDPLDVQRCALYYEASPGLLPNTPNDCVSEHAAHSACLDNTELSDWECVQSTTGVGVVSQVDFSVCEGTRDALSACIAAID